MGETRCGRDEHVSGCGLHEPSVAEKTDHAVLVCGGFLMTPALSLLRALLPPAPHRGRLQDAGLHLLHLRPHPEAEGLHHGVLRQPALGELWSG